MSLNGDLRLQQRFMAEPPRSAVVAPLRRSPRLLRIAIGVALVLALSGCGRLFKASCAKPDDYAAAAQNAPLKVPPGLTAPDTRSAMPIPALDEPERPRSADEPCIDAPPRYAEPKPTPPPAA